MHSVNAEENDSHSTWRMGVFSLQGEEDNTMKQVRLPIPELGLIAVTRGILGAGVALLLADKLSRKTQKTIGWTLFLAGALSTVPLIMDVVRKRRLP